MRQIVKKLTFLQAMGLRYFFYSIRQRFIRPRIRFAKHLHLFNGAGLEIGGPSSTFTVHGLFPVYKAAQVIDNVNFSQLTRWEGALKAGKNFVFDQSRESGTQFVLEGLDLSICLDSSYDFILSCHMLEHTANPLRALKEWRRVLRDGGNLLLVLPHRDGSFDHRRPITDLKHLVDDFANDVGEDDRTHLQEIVELHDLRRDPQQASASAFDMWIKKNVTNRGAHQHVFDTRAAVRMLVEAGFEVIDVEAAMPYHIFCLARKGAVGTTLKGESAVNAHSQSYRDSPFPTDRFAASAQGEARPSKRVQGS